MIEARTEKEHYKAIDGLRAMSCLAIIAMHIQANTEYNITGFLWERLIPSGTWLVYLFLMISGFGMCAGYLSRFHENKINLEEFYIRRYGKVLPFFAFLILIALFIEPSANNFYEASIELTLLHGLLPNNRLEVLGVCWTLGVIFVFYLLFPAFTVLLRKKVRAWISLGVSLWLNFICIKYFFGETFVVSDFAPRHSFIYCIPMFIIGGILYIYCDEIHRFCSKYYMPALLLCILVTGIYYLTPFNAGGVLYYFL